MDHFPRNFLTVEDFLENRDFRRWVRDRKAEDREYWQEWLVQNPEHREVYEQAVALYLVIQGSQINVANPKNKKDVRQIHNQLINPDGAPTRVLSWQRVSWLVAASVLIGLIGWQFGAPFFKSIRNIEGVEANRNQTNTWQIVTNNTDKPKLVLLPENSSILLYPDSQIRFRSGENNVLREVYLLGEGFFEVSKNPEKPFMVYATNFTAKVLGTSFQVRSFDDEATSFVKVKTGTVAVYSNKSPEEKSLLKVNEQLTLNTKTEKIEKQEGRVFNEDLEDIISKQFSFEFSPIPLVFEQLESSYHMPIHYDRKLLQNCTFTGQLNDSPFLEKIRLICLTIESTYEIVDNQIIIHSRGCS